MNKIPFFLFWAIVSVFPSLAVGGEYDADISKEALSGDAKSQFALALLYEYGSDFTPRNPEKSIIWFEKAGRAGVAGACLYLGLKYEHGASVTQDFSKAECWYTCAAQQGWPLAQFFLAGLYEHGKGVPVSIITSLAWMGLAAEHEYPGAAEEYTRILEATGFKDFVQLSVKQEVLLSEERTPCN